ncbi:hypothetical protein QRX60_21350 [Amycolatopsis mongoliensis]|uniref:Uncharacterized protein n=1 Tax=Amycolatopsis mongoliensis TaxID=715475 RepID=A0A9Y2JY05_9PSEU|nr:hypothetical protein [Amycolatopsis sp. 4-36]WIY06263.1 hypothetical protein QRX60_21350 [Amycolatopsis sp. 4-36]
MLWGWLGPADLDELPISADLRVSLESLAEQYDESLNWDYPPDPGPWREARCVKFNADTRAALARLRAELGRDVEDGFTELHEDPELDRYLADPKGFERQRTSRKNVRTSSTNSSGCS